MAKVQALAQRVDSEGAGRTTAFHIEDESFIIGLLRDSIYSDKEAAVVREYVTNGIDEHKLASFDGPVEVWLPTFADPEFVVRDYGRGMSDDEMATYFAGYGASTKRDDDRAAGMLGIGCKAGFAYTTAFAVTSWYKGEQSIYTCSADSDSSALTLAAGPLPAIGETGMEIRVPVRQEDMRAFLRAASKTLSFFGEGVKILRGEVDPLPGVDRFGPAFIVPRADRGAWPWDGWVAVMGGVPYSVDQKDLASLFDETKNEGDLLAIVESMVGGWEFPMGAIDPAPSRERVQFTKRSKKAIKKATLDLHTAVLDNMLRNTSGLAGFALFSWRRDMISRHFEGWYDKNLFDNRLWVEVPEDPGFSLHTLRTNEYGSTEGKRLSDSLLASGVSRFEVFPNTVIYLMDTRVYKNAEYAIKSVGYKERVLMAKFPLPSRSLTDQQRTDALGKVQAFLKSVGLSDLPVLLMSEQKEEKKKQSGRWTGGQERYRKLVFATDRHHPSHSYDWEIVEPEDVEEGGLYIPIYRFQIQAMWPNGPINAESLATYLAKAGWKGTVPPVYGVKQTAKTRASETAEKLGLTDLRVFYKKVAAELTKLYAPIVEQATLKDTFCKEWYPLISKIPAVDLLTMDPWSPLSWAIWRAYYVMNGDVDVEGLKQARNFCSRFANQEWPAENGEEASALLFRGLAGPYPLLENPKLGPRDYYYAKERMPYKILSQFRSWEKLYNYTKTLDHYQQLCNQARLLVNTNSSESEED